jgi:hypothetical protein
MHTYPLSPIFIRPPYPSIQSRSTSSTDATPAIPPTAGPRQVASYLEPSKCAEATTSTSSPLEYQSTPIKETWQPHTTLPLTAATSPWYTHRRTHLQALHLNIPCSAYTTTHRMYLQQHRSNSNATTALYRPPPCLTTP